MGIRVAWTIEWQKQKQKQKQKFQTTPTPCGSGLARDGSTLVIQVERGGCIAGKPGSHREHISVANPASKQAGRSAASGAFDFDLPAHREAEWRFCAVGLPAWMPGEPRWAMDGPWRRAHGANLHEGT